MLANQRFANNSFKQGHRQKPSRGVSRNLFTHWAIRRAASSTSAAPRSALRLKRIAECSTSPVLPIAAKTGEGNSEPLEQADPVEQAMSARSRLIRSASASKPGND